MWKFAPLVAFLLLIPACQDAPPPAAIDTQTDTPPPNSLPTQIEEEEELTPGEPDLVTVPDVEGQRLAEARRDLRDAGLGVTVSKRPSDETLGTVLSQRPIFGIDVRSGRTIRLVVAKPRPEPAANCHPSYTGACLDPNASDYDCAGGSGDGPKYTGTVTVVGPDVFGLDGDSDGIGCE